MKIASRRAEKKSNTNESILAGTHKKDKYLDESGSGLNKKGIKTVEKLGLKDGFMGIGGDKRLSKAADIVRAALSNSGKWDSLHKMGATEESSKATRQAVSQILGKSGSKKDWAGDTLNDLVSSKLDNRILYETDNSISEKSKRTAKKRHYY